MPAANRLPHSSNVSRCRSAGSSSASRQLRRNTRLGWLVTSRSISLDFTPIRSHTANATSGTCRLPRASTLVILRLGEADAALAGPGLPPLARRVDRRWSCRRRTRRRCGTRRRGSATASDTRHQPTAAPSPGTEACALRRTVCWSKICPAAFCATAISAVRPSPGREQLAGQLQRRARTPRIRRCAGRAPTSVSCQGDAPSHRRRRRTACRASGCG